MDRLAAKAQLIRLLQRAYSGELAAAHAYRGHWRAVKDPTERRDIQKIEQDELHHREQLGKMIAELGAAPDCFLERKMSAIGKTIGVLCHISGWYIPMYGAGRLEKSNVREYEHAARFAHLAGEERLIEDLLTWAETEWDHEKYFREKARSHWLRYLIPIWTPPATREAIRSSFDDYRRINAITESGDREPAPNAV
ncbi:MAG: ferritin-like domain-containing protein [Planctomycetes bacterium]|nr:ferritin-like domain-containing protein [Planctomycetota bacterium]NUQ34703.1 ferritin-like domain-containing protein [Planctomycetaceae bacterium]